VAALADGPRADPADGLVVVLAGGQARAPADGRAVVLVVGPAVGAATGAAVAGATARVSTAPHSMAAGRAQP
jgi:hypothetical protein